MHRSPVLPGGERGGGEGRERRTKEKKRWRDYRKMVEKVEKGGGREILELVMYGWSVLSRREREEGKRWKVTQRSYRDEVITEIE